MSSPDRHIWSPVSHEAGVEKFYASGIDGYHEYHGGYLSFGLWDREGMTYEEAAEHLVEEMGRRLGLTAESVLLDIGCGMGSQDVHLINRFHPRSIDAVDLTWKHIERARERARRAGIGEEILRFHHGTATRLPFADAAFTHILSIEAIEHVNTREDFYREAFRVLRPGGVLCCADYSMSHPPRSIFDRLLFHVTRLLWHVPSANVYGDDGFRDRLRAVGFGNITIESIGSRVIPGYYFEHRRPESVRRIRAIRGFWKGVIGGYVIDRGVYEVYRRGLCEYVIVRAEKPV